MGLAIKSVIGLVSMLGSSIAVGVPLATLASNTSVGTILEAGGGNSSESLKANCRSLEDRVSFSVVYLVGLETDPGFGEIGCNKQPIEKNSQLKVVLSRDNKVDTKKISKEKDGKTGISDLVKIALEKINSNQLLGTGGGLQEGWSSSFQNVGERSKSFMLTGTVNVGEYLMGTAGLKDEGDKSNGVMLVAKKEVIHDPEGVTIKIGGKEGQQENNSPQVQVKKEELTNGAVTVKIVKSYKGSKRGDSII